MQNKLIRNFCIIAHIDHGKSTLADRILQFTGAITEREFHAQFLDDMELEQERGITIKASAVQINYQGSDSQTYLLNLIDTPGHVDFSYEVSKSLAACEGAVLVVDAAQGVEAQTVANYHLACEHKLDIITVINKIDLPNAQPQIVKEQIINILKIKKEPILASAKEGIGTKEILERIILEISPPGGSIDNPLQALIFDSAYNVYKGVIIYVRLMNGVICPGLKILMLGTKRTYEVTEVGVFKPKPEKVRELVSGQVGFLYCNIKDPKEVKIGDTVTSFKHPASLPLPGYKNVMPLVFCGLYPVSSKDFSLLRDALDKMSLTDSSFTYSPETSVSLGLGFRCGFLGLLHMDVTQERLEREYDLNLIATTPSVVYRVIKTSSEIIEVDSPADLPEPQQITQIEEPYIRTYLIVPQFAMNAVVELSKSKRGIFKKSEYLGEERMLFTYDFPLAEVIVDFYDKIKSITKGYGSMDYEFIGYQPTKLVKLDVLINAQLCDALSLLLHRDKAQYQGRQLVEKLKEVIPRQLYEVVIQAAIGSKIIARSTVRPLGKHVTGKCYGGDITRKRKLWEKQKEGKKRLKQFGKVQIPQEAFMAVLKI
ncbi:MAG: translation elongation factor 4 [Candidatus Omnitrophota bacterium]